ncbi:MAG TPA: hypothetical protein VLT33_42190, partial [Labilithrix sp.]|nr:hypothetical protein [Labilithrix sp.]
PHEVDARADIWSLGVCGWAIAAGELPFSQNDLIILFASILNRQAPSIATVRPELPEPFVRAIDRCLQRSRDDRFRDVGELAEVLGPLTTERTRPLVEHTRLLLERGRTRATGTNPRSSFVSLSEIAPPAGDATRAEGRAANLGGNATATLSSAPPPPLAPAAGATGGAMVISHTMPVMPPQAALPGHAYPAPPSAAPPALAPAPPPGRAAIFVGSLVVAFAAVVVIVVGVRVLPRLGPSAATTAPPPAQVSPPPVASIAPPPPAAPEPPSAAVAPSLPASVSTSVAPPPPASVSASPKRVPVRPAAHAPPDGIPTSRGVPSSRE